MVYYQMRESRLQGRELSFPFATKPEPLIFLGKILCRMLWALEPEPTKRELPASGVLDLDLLRSCSQDCTDREINAVDSEFQAGLTNPFWRDIGEDVGLFSAGPFETDPRELRAL